MRASKLFLDLGLGRFSRGFVPSEQAFVLEGVQETLLELGVLGLARRLAHAEHDVDSLSELVLVQAEEFAEASLDLVAYHGFTDSAGGGDADAWTRNIRAFTGADAGKECEELAAVRLAKTADLEEVGVSTQAASRAEFVSPYHVQAGWPGKPDLRNGEAGAAFLAARFDDGTSTAGGHAGAEANLAYSLEAMWSECRSHDVKIRKRARKWAAPGRAVKPVWAKSRASIRK